MRKKSLKTQNRASFFEHNDIMCELRIHGIVQGENFDGNEHSGFSDKWLDVRITNHIILKIGARTICII